MPAVLQPARAPSSGAVAPVRRDVQGACAPLIPGPVAAREAAARRDLRAQIARLELDLAASLAAAFPRREPLRRGDRPTGLAAAFPRREPLCRGDRPTGLAAEFPCREPLCRGDRPTGLAGPRLLATGDLERVRDELVGRVEALRTGGATATLAAMLADPAGHRGARVTSAELGEPGCRTWAVRPRLGPLGRLAGWWRVVVSSGCPLRR